MKYINIIFRSTFHTPTAAGWNVIPSASTGAFPLNYSDGSPSPFTMNVTLASTANLNNSTYNLGAKHGIPQDVIKATGSYISSTARTMNISRSDATNIDTLKVWGASGVNDNTRAARWTVEGVTLDHDDRNYGDAAPTSFSLSGASWPIDISVVKAPNPVVYGYPNVIQLEIPDVSYTITSVNSGNPVIIGQSFTGATTGFTNVTSATLGGKALTGVSFLSDTVTSTIPPLADGQTMFEPEVSQTLIYSDGTNTAQLSIPTDLPATMGSVLVTTPVIANNKYLGYWMASLGYTPVTGDRFLYTTADCAVGEIGDVEADAAVTTTIWLWQNSGDVLRSFEVTINEDGSISSVTKSNSLGIGLGYGVGL